MKEKNYVIDVLRWFAAFCVVLFHLNSAIPYIDKWYRNFIKYGWLGVPVFFVISGYCIIISANNSTNRRDFLNRRFFRIFPPYWASLLVVLIAAIFQRFYTGNNSIQNIPRNPIDILATLTLTTSPLTDINTINWVYWTLTCELCFYIIIGAVFFFNKNVSIFLLIGVSLISALFPYQYKGYLFFLDHWPAFGCGLSIYYFFKSSDKITWLSFWLLFVINVCGLVNKFLINHKVEYVVAVLVTLIIIFSSKYLKSSKNIFATLGEFSYSVYLIHVPVGVFIFGRFKNYYILHDPFINLLYDLIIYCIVSILSWKIFNLIEKPSIIYSRKISDKYFNPYPKKDIN
jgi:peptidoglycan/LPS O-acetylase OafA/YrhL